MSCHWIETINTSPEKSKPFAATARELSLVYGVHFSQLLVSGTVLILGSKMHRNVHKNPTK